MQLFASSDSVNVGRLERAVSLATGTVMALLGMRSGSAKGIVPVVTGGLLIRRGLTGHCELYDKLGVHADRTSQPLSYEEGVKVSASIIINRSPQDVYAFWRQLENLPQFMWHVKKVTVEDRKYSHWELKVPLGRPLQWDAAIINDIPGQLIAWKSLPGADIDSAGSVTFKEASYDRGTHVRLTMHYSAPGGSLGTTIARMMGHDPADAAQMDLDRLKHLLEDEDGAGHFEGRSHKLTRV